MRITATNTIVHDGGVAAPGEVFDIDEAEGLRLCGLGAAACNDLTDGVYTEALGPIGSGEGTPVEGRARKTRAKKGRPVSDAPLEPESGEEGEE